MELLLVLALLGLAVSVSAPSLARFYRGRALDSEARRLLALTRYAQSRAVSEGVPMVVWFKPDAGTYGLQAEATYLSQNDNRAVDFELDSCLQMQLAPVAPDAALPPKITSQIAGIHPAIRFTPDGFISDSSPAWISIKVAREAEADAVWLALDEHNLKYELQNTQPLARR
jgi:Tfp pilus assembly protein FimT